MKKKYSKPYLAVESFQLDAAIAGSCEANPLNHSVYECTYWDEDSNQKLDEVLFGTACAEYVLPNGDYGIDVIGSTVAADGICYQAFNDGTYLAS